MHWGAPPVLLRWRNIFRHPYSRLFRRLHNLLRTPFLSFTLSALFTLYTEHSLITYEFRQEKMEDGEGTHHCQHRRNTKERDEFPN